MHSNVDNWVMRNIHKVYVEANDISGSKRGITAHAIGLSLRLSVFNLALAWWLHNMYGLNWVSDSQTRFFSIFGKREKIWKMGFRSRTGSNASRGSRGSHEFGDISMRRNYSSIMPVRENVALRLRSESLLQIEDRLDDILDQFCYTDRDCSEKKLPSNDCRA